MHRDVAAAVAVFADLDGVADVLDVATGTGLVLRSLHSRRGGLRLAGADLSPRMLAVARAQLPTASWIVADARSLPVDDCSVDLITCVTALHVIPDTAGAISEWRRVLRPGGRAVTATFLDGGRRRPAPVRPSYPSDHAPFGSVERLERTAAEGGLSHLPLADVER
ncbi:class I SAM-dependent methyltransferase [Microbacterium sp. CIAB417]|uniref:class I SAM-dependent methyltransferase n=1 Tax=Microbacterium sp. CIAB417 TaxID=2860287 RepID=UPI001FACFAE9|nr:class I SAM-dependent methyltransferase [Microbacterium sp. CIAB417]